MATVQKNNFGSTIKEYALISFGILCYALSWDIFLIPNNLVGGGITGLGSIIQYATHGVIKVSYSYFTINIILLVLGMLTLGRSFGVKTVYAILLATVVLDLGQTYIPGDFIQSLAIDNGKLLSVIMGGMLSGFGIGLTMSQGGSTGGTDIIALMCTKYRGWSPGKVILWLDVLIIASSMLVPSFRPDGTLLPLVDKILVVVYGFVLTAVLSFSLDWTLSGSKQSVQIFITSKRYSEIADTITGEFHRGVTILHGEGWYSKADANVIMVLTRKADSNVLLRAVKNIDPDAFISVSSVMGVYGRGFDALHTSSKKVSKAGSK